MLSENFLLQLAIILLSTKLLGILSKRFRLPQVVGALIAGLLIGPCVLDFVHENEFMDKLAELGVILLMFSAGMETEVDELKKCGKASLVIALFGVAVPLIGGFGIAMLFNNSGSFTELNSQQILQNVFIGVVLTATSVSITVETLREMGKLKSKAGTAILGAAIIDDILGIIILTVISSFADSSVSLIVVLLKIVAFFIFSFGFGYLFFFIFNKLSKKYGPKRRLPIVGLAFCLVLSFLAEHFFGVADITGAYFAGIVISNTEQSHYVSRRVDIISYMFFAPVFFASIGIKTNLSGMNASILLFTVLMLVIAILSKVLGCGFGARLFKFTKREALQVGTGMISRGEVALIVANKGILLNLMPLAFFAPLIIVVVITTLITPILLKLVFNNKDEEIQCEVS